MGKWLLTFVPGLGKAVALDFALQGCSSIFLGSHQDNDIALKQIAADLQQDHPSTKCAYYASPASGATSSALMVQKCVEAFGSVDYVVNICHGLTERKSVLDVLPDEFNTSIENIMVPVC